MDTFKGYTDAWTRNYESSMSACIGMMQIQPVAIEAPENVNDLLPFILNQFATQISGGAIGKGYKGVMVSEDILKFKQFSIWHESLKEGFKEIIKE